MLGRALLREDGDTIVEFAVSCTVVVGMILGVSMVSYAVYTYHYVSDAAREGARYAIVRGSTSCTNTPALSNCNATAAEIQTHVKSLGYPGIDSTNYMTVATTWCAASTSTPTTWSACSSGTTNAPGNLVSVQVTYNFPFALGFLKVSPISVKSTSEMVISQ